ncbi:MAG TPA: hypothetical protein VIF62_13380 [Labilithrix sp.]
MTMKRALVLLALAACKSSSSSDDVPAPDAGVDSASALPQTCPRGAKNTTATTSCNGADALCSRTYDKVTVPFAHNAMSNRDDGWAIPNQDHGIGKQLTDGVRGLMLDLHYYDPSTNLTDNGRLDGASAQDQVYLCHTACFLGKLRLLDGLCTITNFLDQNPGEIVSIIFETYVADADTAAVLEAAGLAEYAYVHTDASAPWPTLAELVASGKRLVVFVEKGGGAPPYLMPAYTGNIWDTPYDFQTQANFTCALGRGVANSPIFLINHWLSNPTSDISYAREVNVEAVLGKRVDDCTTSAGRAPTFISVDFYDVGDLFTVVKKTNGL